MQTRFTQPARRASKDLSFASIATMTTRVCVCDDDPLITALLIEVLKAAEFVVEEPLSSPAEAITWLTHHTPDVLLLDLNMPSGGGLEVLEHLAALNKIDQTRVLMLTGEDELYFVERAKSLGAVGYLTKPVRPRDLIARIRRVTSDEAVRWVDDYATVIAPSDGRT
jgi:two-component system, NarL family, invasion response regulator UvrY